MSNKTKRLTATGLTSREQFFTAVDEIATLQTKRRILEAKRDKRLQAIQDECAPEIEAATDAIEQRLALAEAYAMTHRDEVLAPGRQSGETELAAYGFRQHPPALKTLNRKWTWETVLEAVKRRWNDRFIRVTEELSKDGLKAELSEAELAEVGCRLESMETFGVTPKVDGGEVEQAAAR